MANQNTTWTNQQMCMKYSDGWWVGYSGLQLLKSRIQSLIQFRDHLSSSCLGAVSQLRRKQWQRGTFTNNSRGKMGSLALWVLSKATTFSWRVTLHEPSKWDLDCGFPPRLDIVFNCFQKQKLGMWMGGVDYSSPSLTHVSLAKHLISS